MDSQSAQPHPDALSQSNDRSFLASCLAKASRLHRDKNIPQLIEMALARGEGMLASNGALVVRTGKRTGRSPKDRFIVEDSVTSDQADWGAINQPFAEQAFDALWHRVLQALAGKELFISHLWAGAQPQHSIPLKVTTELAWHNLFARQLFIRPGHPEEVERADEWALVNLPSFIPEPERDGTHSDGAVIISFSKRYILFLGMQYAGEMKKAVFSVMNFLLPKRRILPMHCAANVGENGDVALFFGLSGTGKTTLSADPDRFLIGDDEHGWDEGGIFNLEGGCYAKCINLTPEREPVIWQAIQFGAVLENVMLDEKAHAPQYDDDSITENTRAAYPREFVPQRMPGNRGGHPQAIIFLTCDLYGVLPPIASLSKEQAAYHFLSGYTALVGSTEVGQKEGVKPTFSACFGAPFFPRKPQVYADLLMEKTEQHQAPVYLVNTGWIGGSYGEDGQRISIATSRALIHAILRGEVEQAAKEFLPGLNLSIPKRIHGIDSHILNPRNTWRDKTIYDRRMVELVKLFQQNFERFEVDPAVRKAGPSL